MQTRQWSIYEAVINIIVGLGLSVLLNFLVLRCQGLSVTWTGMGYLSVIMTVASFLRQYCLRRLFNRWDQ